MFLMRSTSPQIFFGCPTYPQRIHGALTPFPAGRASETGQGDEWPFVGRYFPKCSEIIHWTLTYHGKSYENHHVIGELC